MSAVPGAKTEAAPEAQFGPEHSQGVGLTVGKNPGAGDVTDSNPPFVIRSACAVVLAKVNATTTRPGTAISFDIFRHSSPTMIAPDRTAADRIVDISTSNSG
jgi:hypothetical protein